MEYIHVEAPKVTNVFPTFSEPVCFSVQNKVDFCSLPFSIAALLSGEKNQLIRSRVSNYLPWELYDVGIPYYLEPCIVISDGKKYTSRDR